MTIIISKSTSKREPQVAAFKLGQGFMMRLRYFGNAKKKKIPPKYKGQI